MKKIIMILTIASLLLFLVGCDEEITEPIGEGNYENWALTTNTYSETDNLEQAVLDEMGTGWRIADWNDLLAISNDIQNWANSMEIENGDGVLLIRDGNHFWSGNRHYFMRRHNHVVPGGWLVHDDIDDNFIDLGSWYGLDIPILCIYDN
jgi:hypothetical protein